MEIVEPATTVGSSIANGVAAPVRPMFTSMRCSIATCRSAGNLNAVAQRGNFDVNPSRSRCATSFNLITTPSVSKARPVRLSRHSSQNATTASMPSHSRQCGSTARPQALRPRSISECRGGSSDPPAPAGLTNWYTHAASPRFATSAGSRFRMVPAAVLRALAYNGSPAASCSWFIRSNAFFGTSIRPAQS